MPITNALDNARKMERLGFSHEQARGLADIMEDNANEAQPDLSQLATKNDVQVLRAEYREELRRQMLWFFTMLVGLLGLTIAVLKIFP